MLDTKGNKITYFGHATFSLTTPSGQVGLIDPFVSQSIDAGKAEEILAARRDLCFACAQRPLRRLRRIGKEA